MFSCEFCDIFKIMFVTDVDLDLFVYVQPFKSSLHRINYILFCIFILHTIKICETKYVNFIKWYMLYHNCSLPFIVQAHCSLFPEWLVFFSQNSAKYSGVCQSQKNNPKILEYFEFATSSEKFLNSTRKTLVQLEVST